MSFLSNAYDELSKIRALIDSAKQLIDDGGQSDEQKAITALTQACNLALTFLPAGRLGLMLTMSIDMALEENEANACEDISQIVIQNAIALGDEVLTNLDSQTVSRSLLPSKCYQMQVLETFKAHCLLLIRLFRSRIATDRQ